MEALFEKMVVLLEKNVQNTEPKTGLQIIVSNDKTVFTTRFNPPIQLDKNKQYEIALVNLETYYSFPNIDASNNYFRYSPDAGVTWFEIYIPEGSYDIVDINDTVQQKMRQNGHYDSANITISANSNTLKSVLILENDYQVDFRQLNSISKLLGFNNDIYTLGFQESENVVNILSINSLLVNLDIISGSYVNSSTQNTIYSFFPNVSPGYKIVESPINLVYLPITLDTIHSLETSITDQDGNQLNLRGETLTMRFHIRKVKKNLHQYKMNRYESETRYVKVKVNISEGQKQKLQSALQVGGPVSIRLGHEDLNGEDVLALTNSQVNKITKAYEGGKGITIKMSKSQLAHNKKVEGGFLGMLASLAARALPMLAKTVLPALGVGALTGLASSGVQKVMGQGLYLKKGGCVCQVETDGKGLYLGPVSGSGFSKVGDGLYLRRGGQLYDGKGLLSMIPVVGPFLESIASL